MMVGLVAAGDTVNAYSLGDDCVPTLEMIMTHTAYIGCNMDTDVRTVTPERWEEVKGVLLALPDVTVNDFTS